MWVHNVHQLWTLFDFLKLFFIRSSLTILIYTPTQHDRLAYKIINLVSMMSLFAMSIPYLKTTLQFFFLYFLFLYKVVRFSSFFVYFKISQEYDSCYQIVCFYVRWRLFCCNSMFMLLRCFLLIAEGFSRFYFVQTGFVFPLSICDFWTGVYYCCFYLYCSSSTVKTVII